jgi:hypothetical protein
MAALRMPICADMPEAYQAVEVGILLLLGKAATSEVPGRLRKISREV